MITKRGIKNNDVTFGYYHSAGCCFYRFSKAEELVREPGRKKKKEFT